MLYLFYYTWCSVRDCQWYCLVLLRLHTILLAPSEKAKVPLEVEGYRVRVTIPKQSDNATKMQGVTGSEREEKKTLEGTLETQF